MKNFKPNLIPNNPKDDSFDMDKVIKKNGGYDQYIVTMKKDGVRMQFVNNSVLSRSLKTPGSKIVQSIYSKYSEVFNRLKISLDGEFYSHGMKFNAIFRFFSKSDVSTPEYKNQLEKEFLKNPEKFAKDYDGLNIDFLTTWHKSLKVHIFDGIVLDRPDLLGYEERMEEIKTRLASERNSELLYAEFSKDFIFTTFHEVETKEQLEKLYQKSLELNYEGLVLTHKKHEYKFGRNTLNEGTILKMKDDAIEFDGVVLEVVEATSVKNGVERSVNELGRSVTSKKKGDRENSGIAKGFKIQYIDDKGTDLGTFTVSLRGFDNETRKDMFLNKDSYIGKHFTYTGMNAVKDFPRHAFFKNWRDEK